MVNLSNSYKMNQSFSSTSSGSAATPQPRFIHRLCHLEEENKKLTEQVQTLQIWKTNLEEWLMENLGYCPGGPFNTLAAVSESTRVTSAEDDGSNHSGASNSTFPMTHGDENGNSRRAAIMNGESDSQAGTVATPSTSGNQTVSFATLKVETESPSEIRNGRRSGSTDYNDMMESMGANGEIPDEHTETPDQNEDINNTQTGDEPIVSVPRPSQSRTQTPLSMYETPTRQEPRPDSRSSDEETDTTPCDICRLEFPGIGDLMLFCDKCNVCVHQRCYGVPVIPDGEWRCRTCYAGIMPNAQSCRFCTTLGGAMIPVQSPAKKHWAHVSCTWWIPGPSINIPEKVDFVIGIPQIEPKRWKLICYICKKGKGSTCCIQCAFKRCSRAFHVTCGFKKGLRMEMIEDDDVDQGIIFLPYCESHRDVRVESPRKKRRLDKAPS